jgi:hypothetical protein
MAGAEGQAAADQISSKVIPIGQRFHTSDCAFPASECLPQHRPESSHLTINLRSHCCVAHSFRTCQPRCSAARLGAPHSARMRSASSQRVGSAERDVRKPGAPVQYAGKRAGGLVRHRCLPRGLDGCNNQAGRGGCARVPRRTGC